MIDGCSPCAHDTSVHSIFTSNVVTYNLRRSLEQRTYGADRKTYKATHTSAKMMNLGTTNSTAPKDAWKQSQISIMWATRGEGRYRTVKPITSFKTPVTLLFMVLSTLPISAVNRLRSRPVGFSSSHLLGAPVTLSRHWCSNDLAALKDP